MKSDMSEPIPPWVGDNATYWKTESTNNLISYLTQQITEDCMMHSIRIDVVPPIGLPRAFCMSVSLT